ncbi:hypothetical protein OEZ86_001030 [Tetradesmus obliquus]|nr:hypothetical protein OEZ86_001030 [Tetradesmus obliquus]
MTGTEDRQLQHQATHRHSSSLNQCTYTAPLLRPWAMDAAGSCCCSIPIRAAGNKGSFGILVAVQSDAW